MASDKRTQLRQLCDDASPGPWEVSSGFPDQDRPTVMVVRPGRDSMIELGAAEDDNNAADAAFIAAARAALPALLEALALAERDGERLQRLAAAAQAYCAAIERGEPPGRDLYQTFKELSA